MNLLCVSISHNTAPLQVRERLWFSPEEIRSFLPTVRKELNIDAAMFSTCNRTELYAFSSDAHPLAFDRLRDLLIGAKSVHDIPTDSFQFLTGVDAIDHLFRVASGVDSLVIGDVQILAQVKDGLFRAQEAGTSGFFLTKLFHAALHTGKRARRETRIGEGAVSVSYAAVELAQKIFDDLHQKTALVIGAGEMAHLTAKHLRGKEIGTLYITNRTPERSKHLAEMVNATVIPYEEFKDHLGEIDIVVASVTAEEYVLTAHMLKEIIKRRNAGALFLIDIGVPRNIDPAVRKLENVFLYDLDNLNGLVHENETKRRNEMPKVTRIVAEEQAEFTVWVSGLHATPTIAALSDLIESIRKEEVAKNINRFDPRDRELVDLVTKRIINKILHTPIVNLKNGSDESHSERLHTISALRKLFGIDGEKDAEHEA
ncbi:MAG: glutamyl-tRNA reductase [Bacteroidota bacterium]